MVHGDSKCYSKGSTAPDIKKDARVLFSMRFCPYAERARLALNAKKIPHEIINIDLQNKPEWFLERNPLGKVPTLEEPGNKITYESLIVAEYLDEVYDSNSLLPKDPFERAQQKILLEIIVQKFCNKFHAARTKSDQESVQALTTGLKEVQELLRDDFFSGKTAGFVDLMVWPWISRIPTLKQIRGLEVPMEQFPKIKAWVERMWNIPYVKESTYPMELVGDFSKDYVQGKPNYDLGLQ